MSSGAISFALRAVAVAIAVAAALDPAVTLHRVARPVVSVVVQDSIADRELAARAVDAVAGRFTVARGRDAGAEATLIVTSGALPHTETPAPAFVVVPDASRPHVRIDALDAPATAPLDARGRVVARVHVLGGRGRSLEVVLLSAGVSVDRASRRVARDDDTVDVPLAFVPTKPGLLALTARATLDGQSATDEADAAVDVHVRRLAVLVYDARPSWMSTFVRRALERDSRFAVVSRTVTSRNVSTDAGAPPARLDDLTALAGVDAVVVGAPDALTPTEVKGLDTYARRRAGGVVLLLDQRAGGPFDALTRVAKWEGDSRRQPEAVQSSWGDSATLRAMDLAWPTALPVGSEILATDGPTPVVWQSAVGAGRLVVSGALDAWRFRDSAESQFDRFWQRVIGDAASASPSPLSVRTGPSIVAPGEAVSIELEARDLVLSAGDGSPAALEASASVAGAPASLWPAGVGRLRGAIRAPRRAGSYRVAVTARGDTASSAFIVRPNARRAAGTAPGLVTAWASSHGGAVVSDRALGGLADQIARAIRPAPTPETSHPMRSPWWLVPFTLALSGEWWLRRRRGLR